MPFDVTFNFPIIATIAFTTNMAITLKIKYLLLNGLHILNRLEIPLQVVYDT